MRRVSPFGEVGLRRAIQAWVQGPCRLAREVERPHHPRQAGRDPSAQPRQRPLATALFRAGRPEHLGPQQRLRGVAEGRWPARLGAVAQAVHALGVEAHHRSAQRLPLEPDKPRCRGPAHPLQSVRAERSRSPAYGWPCVDCARAAQGDADLRCSPDRIGSPELCPSRPPIRVGRDGITPARQLATPRVRSSARRYERF